MIPLHFGGKWIGKKRQGEMKNRTEVFLLQAILF